MFTGIAMSVTISIRIDEEIKEGIEELGYNPGEFLKNILIRELKRERARRALNWLKKNRIKGTTKSSEDMIREDRDAR
jgi:hypothetical protein